jgi:2-oxoisovalerate dehydrogenase E2 component (dihydrolipoyl transacylase)
MTLTIIELPQVGESVTEGVISKWLVQPGAKVCKFDPLLEVMTDKVNMEVPSPFTGTLIKTLVEEGDTVPMGQPIAEMDVEGEVPAMPAVTTAAVTERPPAATAAAAPAPVASFEFVDSVRSVGPTGSGEGGQGRPDALQDASFATPAKLSPLVKRLVDEHGVDATLLTGTGVGGRVTKEDVLRFVEEPKQRAGSPAAANAAALPVVAEAPGTILVLTPLRKTIAQHLERSAREIPAAWTMFETDVTGLVAYRDAQRDEFALEAGVPLTYLPFTAYVVAQALMANPLLNGRWTETGIALHEHVNMGLAVSTDAGLIVPVIHNADMLGVRDLALRAHAVIAAAREGNLRLKDVQGGTFTLNNTGALGSVVSAPIINHPQAAIVTTEAIIKRPVVVGGDAIAARSMMNLCMTFDHRVCDGAEAGKFLADIKARLEAIGEDSSLL